MALRTTNYSLIFLFVFSSCYYDNQEELFQYLNDCDTTNITFSNTIMPIITSECAICHQSPNASGGVSLNNYSEVIVYVNNGQLLTDIKGETNLMPKSGKMTECKISTIEKWINDGAQDN